MNRFVKLAIGCSIASASLAACESNEKKAADFCSVVAKTAAAQEPLVALLNSGGFPDPADVKAALTNFRSQLSDMAGAAPDAIADDMILVVNGFTAFDLGLQKINYDYGLLFSDPEAAAQAEADMATMDAPETQEAMAAVDEFSLTECGIALKTSRG
jgi:hypothetical protein